MCVLFYFYNMSFLVDVNENIKKTADLLPPESPKDVGTTPNETSSTKQGTWAINTARLYK